MTSKNRTRRIEGTVNTRGLGTLKRRKGIIRVLFAIVIIALIGGVSWMVYDQFVKTAPTPAYSPTPPSNTPDPYRGWVKYCSKREQSCFMYPNTWTTQDVGSVDPNGDGISLTSPNGTYLWFQSAVSGLGGRCDPDTDPHMYIDKYIAEPHVSNLYIVETKYGNTGDIIHIGLVNGKEGHAPQTGDVGCPYYTTFKSHHDPSIDSWFEVNGNSSASLKAADISTVELILESYTY